MIEDFRLSIESEMKRRARSNNDMIIERRKAQEQITEMVESSKWQSD